MTVNVPTEKQATKAAGKLFAQLVETVNALAEVDWSAVLSEDPSPDASITRQRQFLTVNGMLAHVAALALEPTEVLLGAMNEVALEAEGATSTCPACLVALPGDHHAWCPQYVDA